MTIPGKRTWRSLLLALALLCGCGGKSTTATVDLQAKLLIGIEEWVLVDCTTGENYCVAVDTLKPWWDAISSPDAGWRPPTQPTPFFMDMRAEIGSADSSYFRNPPCAHAVVQVLEMRTISETIPATCAP